MLVSKTYQIVTEESADHGDFAEQGFIFEEQEMDLEEVINEIKSGGFVEWSSSIPVIGDWISTVDADINHETGEHTYYGLHFKNISEEEFADIVSASK